MRIFRNSRFLFIAIVLSLQYLYAHAPDTLWTKTYGGNYTDIGRSVIQTADRGFILVGYTGSFGAQMYDYYIVKTDANGDTLWTKRYGGQYRDEAYSVAQALDYGYIMSGWSSSFASGRNIWVVRLDSLGDTLWAKLHKGQGYSWGWCVRELLERNTYVVSGHDGGSALLLKLNQNGDTLWARHYGNGCLYHYQQTMDSGFIAVGDLFPSNLLFLLKTDKDGNSVWTKTYAANAYNGGYCLRMTSDGGYIIAGYTRDTSNYDMYVLKTNSNGDTLWTRVLGGTDNEEAYTITEAEDHGYIAAGYTGSFGAGSYDMWLVKFDSLGDTLWTKTIGDTSLQLAYTIQKITDGGYIVLGQTRSQGAGLDDFYLVKLDGQTGVVTDLLKPRSKQYFVTTIISGPITFALDKKYKIFDCIGRRVVSCNLPPGVYFLQTEGWVSCKLIKVK